METMYLPWPVYILMLIWLALIAFTILVYLYDFCYWLTEKMAARKRQSIECREQPATDENYEEEVKNYVA